jgi:hypothetical protein
MFLLMVASAYWHWYEKESSWDRYAIFLMLSYLLAQPTGEAGWTLVFFALATGAYVFTYKSFVVVGIMGGILTLILAILNWPYAIASVVAMSGALVSVAVLDKSSEHTGPSHGAWHILSATALTLTHIGIEYGIS